MRASKGWGKLVEGSLPAKLMLARVSLITPSQWSRVALVVCSVFPEWIIEPASTALLASALERVLWCSSKIYFFSDYSYRLSTPAAESYFDAPVKWSRDVLDQLAVHAVKSVDGRNSWRMGHASFSRVVVLRTWNGLLCYKVFPSRRGIFVIRFVAFLVWVPSKLLHAFDFRVLAQ